MSPFATTPLSFDYVPYARTRTQHGYKANLPKKKCINMIILYLAISYLLELMYKTISTSVNIFQNFRHFRNENITKFMKISFIRNTSIWLHSLRLDWCLRLAQKQLLWHCAWNTDCLGCFLFENHNLSLFLSKISCIGNFQSISITLSEMSCIFLRLT